MRPASQFGEHGGFRPGRRQVERPSARIAAGTVSSSSSSSDRGADDVEHPGQVVVGRADVAGGELVLVGELGEGSGALLIGHAAGSDARRVVVPEPNVRSRTHSAHPALSSVPESFTRHRCRAFPVGEPGPRGPHCSPASPHPSGPLRLRDSGVGCSFGAASQRAALPDGFVSAAEATPGAARVRDGGVAIGLCDRDRRARDCRRVTDVVVRPIRMPEDIPRDGRARQRPHAP